MVFQSHVYYLERHLALLALIPREIDFRHTARAEAAQQAVVTQTLQRCSREYHRAIVLPHESLYSIEILKHFPAFFP
jgi:hypothetical protein